MATKITIGQSVNAWILLSEDEPAGTGYQDPTSCYQTLINYNVYQNVDFLSLCWCEPVAAGSSYTVQINSANHPGGVTNQQYMQWVIAAARAANPDIKILIMLGYGATGISQIFGSDQSQWPREAAAFATNLVGFLQANDFDGFDVDWESRLCDDTQKQQYIDYFAAIRAAFDTAYQKTGRYHYLAISPAVVTHMDSKTTNDCFDFINLQLYSGFTFPSDFIIKGIDVGLLAYGAKFESIGNGNMVPYQNAQNAYNGTNLAGCSGYVQGPNGDGNPPYVWAINWRLNSGEFMYEQAQQIILYELVHGIPGPAFSDVPIIQLASQSADMPLITQIVVRSGEVLDSIQVTSVGTWTNDNQTVPLPPYSLPQHGGNGGSSSPVLIPSGDTLATVSGYTGDWYGRNCVLQITLTTTKGVVFGPFGNMGGSSSRNPFTYTAPPGQSIIAFSGTTETVPMAGGGSSAVITSLGVTFG